MDNFYNFQVYGVRSHNGKIAWQHFFRSLVPFNRQGDEKLLLFIQRTTAHFPHPPQCAILGASRVSLLFLHVKSKEIKFLDNAS